MGLGSSLGVVMAGGSTLLAQSKLEMHTRSATRLSKTLSVLPCDTGLAAFVLMVTSVCDYSCKQVATCRPVSVYTTGPSSCSNTLNNCLAALQIIDADPTWSRVCAC